MQSISMKEMENASFSLSYLEYLKRVNGEMMYLGLDHDGMRVNSNNRKINAQNTTTGANERETRDKVKKNTERVKKEPHDTVVQKRRHRAKKHIRIF